MVSTVNKSKTEESSKDLWGTGLSLRSDAEALYGRAFKTDVCTFPHNAQANQYILPPSFLDSFLDYRGWREKENFQKANQLNKTCIGFDGLNRKVPWGNDWFCNPPFSDQLRKAFITRALHEQYRGNAGTMILPYAPATGWFRQYLGKGVIIYEPDGRYNYNDTNGLVQKGCNFDSCVVVFPTCYLRDSIRIPYDRFIRDI